MSGDAGTARPAGDTAITLLTGFLGAGKTTLLNHLLTAQHGRRLGVIVNDFGELDVDSRLVVDVEGSGQDRTISLANGCICCTLSEDFVEAVCALLGRPDRPDHVLIEASGAGDPVNLARTLALMERTTAVRLDAIVTVVDAEGFPTLEGEAAALARRQVKVADLVLLNKRDLVGEPELAALTTTVAALAPQARLWPCQQSAVPLEVLLGAAPDGRVALEEEEPRTVGHGLRTWTYRQRRPLHREAVEQAMRLLPAGLYRAKGFFYLAEHPETEAVLHVVGKRVSLTRGRPWPGPPSTECVFIGTPLAAAGRASIAAALDAAAARGLQAAWVPFRRLFRRR